ncbi:hypothetical protein [Paraburkholderia fungorum]|uniref:hypothetical protein n=1 Tax=Paraburkholderia fungorum TaxID=134537 RepID=UPI0038BD02F8
MFHIQTPVAQLDVQGRAAIYREYVANHRADLQDVVLGPHNDMIILSVDKATLAKSAVLFAVGSPGDLVQFPLHLHTKGEIQICLDGTYGELLAPDQNIDDLLPWGQTFDSFQTQHPGVVSLGQTTAPGQMLLLAPGAGWNFVSGSQHAPCGWIGQSGYLLAQIYWPGPNEVPPGALPS